MTQPIREGVTTAYDWLLIQMVYLRKGFLLLFYIQNSGEISASHEIDPKFNFEKCRKTDLSALIRQDVFHISFPRSGIMQYLFVSNV